MIHHVMADGSKRKSINGCVIPKEISESLLAMIFCRKEIKDGDSNKTRTIREE